MNNERTSCERTRMNMRMTALVPNSDTQGGGIAQGIRQMKQEDQLVTTKLLTVVSELIEMMADASSEDRDSARECVRYASAALLSCAREVDCPVATEHEAPMPRVFRGGLAPWQVRRLSAYIDANLSTSLSCEILARLARLSASHFARAFKHTFGYPPHAFLMRRRVERAQGLMLKTNVPLGQIASECGFADQAHFSRSFLQFTGESPGSWRRARVSARE
jgi:AraC family transcriptional regulator